MDIPSPPFPRGLGNNEGHPLPSRLAQIHSHVESWRHTGLDPSHDPGKGGDRTGRHKALHGPTKGLYSHWLPLSPPRPPPRRCSDGRTPVLPLGAAWRGDCSLQNIVWLAVETTPGGARRESPRVGRRGVCLGAPPPRTVGEESQSGGGFVPPPCLGAWGRALCLWTNKVCLGDGFFPTLSPCCHGTQTDPYAHPPLLCLV